MNRIYKIIIISIIAFSAVPAWSKPAEYTSIDIAIRSMPPAKTIKDVIQFIEANSRNDREKARGVYIWITGNISYDADAFFHNTPTKTDADGVFETRMSICEGYSTLYEKIAKGLGLQVQVIHGYAKGYGYKTGMHFTKTNHAWNAVKFDGEWHLLDTTWGAGYVNKNGGKFTQQFEPLWFDTDSRLFLFHHFPEDTAWQLKSPQITLAEFEKAPMTDPFIIKKLTGAGFSPEMILNYSQLTILDNDSAYYLIELAKAGFFIESISDYSKGLKLNNNLLYYLKSFKIAGLPRESFIEFSKYLPLRKDLSYIPEFIKIGGTFDDILSYAKQGSMPAVYIPEGKTIRIVEYPRVNQVVIGAAYHLAVHISDCEKAAFCNGRKYFYLKKDGDLFTGDIRIKPDDDYLQLCVHVKDGQNLLPVISWEIQKKKGASAK